MDAIDRDALAENNMAIVTYMRKRMAERSTLNSDDLQDALLLGYARAVCTYNPALSFAFSTYAVTCMHNEVRKALVHRSRHPQPLVSLDQPVPETADAALVDSIVDPCADTEKSAIARVILQSVPSLLTEPELQLICERLNGSTVTQMAQKRGVSAACISKKLRAAADKIRAAFDETASVDRKQTILKQKGGKSARGNQ